MITELTITQPDDFHLHLRDNDVLKDTVAASARYFSRAIIMPNLVPPVTTSSMAQDYMQRILEHIPDNSNFTPLMTLYLTDHTYPEHIKEAKDIGIVSALKLYPAGATTNSDDGVTAIEKIYPTIEAMIDADFPLLIHGEVTTSDIDIFAREKVFIDKHLKPLIERYPELRVVMEHITTQDAVEFISESSANIAATITPQHLLFNRNDMLVGGIRPHLYCLPILKRFEHQKALIKAATSGNPCFFLGTDSAPHSTNKKESACGCAGCFSACYALEMYAEVFEHAGALDKLEGFTSHHGADFYRLPRNTKKVVLHKTPAKIPKELPLGNHMVSPLCAGHSLQWSVFNNA